MKFWLNVINFGGPIPDNVYDYHYNEVMDYFDSGKRCFPEIREIENLLDIFKFI